MARWTTLKDFRDASESKWWTSQLIDMIKRTPKRLLPQLINHPCQVISWAVKRRLESKEFSVVAYYEEGDHNG